MNIDDKINELYDLLINNKQNYNDILKEVDALLETNSNNEQLYELKCKILYFSKKYNICQNFCDEALRHFPNNTNILLHKAECLYQKEQYNIE